MTAVAGFNSRVLASSLNLACQVRQSTANSAQEALDVSVLCNTGGAKTYLPGALVGGSFAADGPLDVASSSNEPFDILTAWKGTNVPITFGIAGLDAGDSAWLMDGVQTSFDSTAAHSGTVDFSVAAQTTGMIGIGTSCGFETISATGNGSAVDLGASGANGAVLHLHVTEFTSLTSDTVTIEDSANGSTGWATIATFTAATGLTSERISITGTVERYVRVVDTFSGSGSIIRGVAIAKL